MVALPALAALMPPRGIGIRRTRTPRPRLNLALTACASIAAVLTLFVAYSGGASHLAWTPLPPASLAALDACPGNLYNRYDEGGYLIWFAPDHRVFLDGRQDPYSLALIAEQVHVETTGDFAATFRRYDIRCAYTPAGSLVTARLVQAGWKPLYRDADWAVLAATTIDAETAGIPEHADPESVSLRLPRVLRAAARSRAGHFTYGARRFQPPGTTPVTPLLQPSR